MDSHISVISVPEYFMANVKMQFFIYLRNVARYYEVYKGVKIYLEFCRAYVTTRGRWFQECFGVEKEHRKDEKDQN